MAKSKRSTALFEVINRSKSMGRESGRSLTATPRWWFRRAASADAPAARNAAPAQSAPALQTAPAPVVQAVPGSQELYTLAAPVAQGVQSPVSHVGFVAQLPDVTIAPRLVEPAPAEPARPEPEKVEPPARVAPRRNLLATIEPDEAPKSFAFRVDQGVRQVVMRMNYTAAIIGAFAILVALGLAVIVGQHMNPKPTLLLSEHTSSEVKGGSVQPDLLDVKPTKHSQSIPPVTTPGASSPHNTDTPARKPTAPTPAPSTPVEGKRQNGLNYVVVQSYADEKIAKDAVDCLARNGIPCTIEQGLRGWGHASYIVVGLEGFARFSSQEYKDYTAKILKVSEIFAPMRNGQKSYKAFQPTGYKWDASN